MPRAALTLFLVAACLFAAGIGFAQSRPNIIFIYADDLGFNDVSFNGRKEWKTPNMDRLARQGTIFRRWYTAGVTCGPSRAALMTGKYGIHNGVSANDQDLPRNQVTVAQALKDVGYATALTGKWHHGATRPDEKDYVFPLDRGFDEFFGYTDAVQAWEKFPKQLYVGRELKPVNGYADTLFTDRAIDFIRRHKSGPFYLYLPYIAPHFNVDAPPEDIAEMRRKMGNLYPNNPLAPVYAAMITRMDKEIGRVMKTLKDIGLAKNTIVILSSDHGATFEKGNQGCSATLDSNAPFRGQKRTVWEGGIRVPAVVRWPGIVPAGKISNEVMHMTDVMPTLLAAAGVTQKPEWQVDGRNMLDVWKGNPSGARGTIFFWEWRAEGANQIAAMCGNLKLVITGNTPPELFNIETDPAERNNRIAEFPKAAAKLQSAVRNWIHTETADAKFGTPRAQTAFNGRQYPGGRSAVIRQPRYR